MPKRKHDDDYDRLSRKIRKLEKKLRRKRRRSMETSDSSMDSSPQLNIPEDSEQNDYLRSEADRHSINDSKESSPTPNQLRSQVTQIEPLEKEASSSAVDKISTDNPQGDNAVELDTLDSETLEILGECPTSTKKYGNEIQKDLAVRFEHGATLGLSKDAKKELLDKYLIPDNCKLVDAPLLNAEIKAALSDIVAKRDNAIAQKQKQMASAISSLSEAITLLIKSKNKNSDLLRLLMDTGRMLCDCQYSDSLTRRNYILSALKKDLKEQLRTTKIDDYLFGQNLADTLKAAKAINKSGAELKSTPAPKPQTKKPVPSTSKTLNWKGPPARRQPAPQRTKEPAPPRQRQQNNSKPSYNQQNSSRGRR